MKLHAFAVVVLGAVVILGCGSAQGRTGDTPMSGDTMASTTPAASSSQHPLDMRPVGELPPEVIQKIVRQNFHSLRLCYEQALRNNRSVGGKISVSFSIERDGGVSHVQKASSDLPDTLVSCILQTFSTLSFPPPKGSIVTVVYPLSFSPGE